MFRKLSNFYDPNTEREEVVVRTVIAPHPDAPDENAVTSVPTISRDETPQVEEKPERQVIEVALTVIPPDKLHKPPAGSQDDEFVAEQMRKFEAQEEAKRKGARLRGIDAWRQQALRAAEKCLKLAGCSERDVEKRLERVAKALDVQP